MVHKNPPPAPQPTGTARKLAHLGEFVVRVLPLWSRNIEVLTLHGDAELAQRVALARTALDRVGHQVQEAARAQPEAGGVTGAVKLLGVLFELEQLMRQLDEAHVQVLHRRTSQRGTPSLAPLRSSSRE